MEDKKNDVPYIVHEGILARLERIIKRLWITIILLIVLLVGSNIAWIHYECQFEDQTTIKQDVDTSESPAYVNGTGELTINGEGKTNYNEETGAKSRR